MCGVEKGHEIITKILAFKILDGPLLNGWPEIGNKLGYIYVLSHEDVNIVMSRIENGRKKCNSF